MINRYLFTKKLYSDYLVIIYRLGNYYSFYSDKDITEYIRFKGNTKILKKKRINYLILSNLDIIEINRYDDNTYNYYVMLVIIIRVLRVGLYNTPNASNSNNVFNVNNTGYVNNNNNVNNTNASRPYEPFI